MEEGSCKEGENRVNEGKEIGTKMWGRVDVMGKKLLKEEKKEKVKGKNGK